MSYVLRMPRTIDPRTRPALLEAANHLFYRDGIAAVGVDDIAAASRLSKPTLYRHFDSKEALVRAYLDQRHDNLTRQLRQAIATVPPNRRPLAIIDWLCTSIVDNNFNGCAFVRAYAEAPSDREIRKRAEKRKRVLLEAIVDACRDAGVSEPEGLASQLALIVEGATTTAYTTGERRRAIEAARSTAAAVLREAGLEAAA
jgi:AcrR family transcriptional regulator